MTIWYNSVDNTLHDDQDDPLTWSLPVWPQGMSIASQSQIQAILNPVKSPKEIAIQKIASLEATITDRRIREAVLGIDNGWLKSVNDEITTLRAQL